MAYKLNKTDGSILVELVDGVLDTTTLNINLIGKNYQGFGESINENFIKILENFSNSAAPNAPIKGQLWYDSGTGRLKVYDGSTFRSTDSTIFSSSQPEGLIQGDIWIDGSNDQLKFWNGTEAVLVGPIYSKTQQKTGDVVETIKDTAGQTKVVIKKYINGALLGIYAKEAFTPFPAIVGFDSLVQGFNVNGAFPNYTITGKALYADQLSDGSGGYVDVDALMRTTQDDVTTGRITIANDGGLIVGNDSDITLRVEGQTTVWQNNISNADHKISMKENYTNGAGNQYTLMYFDAWNENRIERVNPTDPQVEVVAGPAVGILTDTPAYALDVNGSVRITKDLMVEGDSIALDVFNLRIEDKQIELAITDDSTLPTDAEVNESGIVVRVTGDDKELLWYQATDSWTSSTNFNLKRDVFSYKIEGVDVLTKDTLGANVVNSSLRTIGQLNSLVVGDQNQSDTMTLTEDRISTTNNLELQSVGSINLINRQKITNVEKPYSAREVAINPLLTEGDDYDVAPKKYVDDEILASPLVTGLDVTGLGTTYATGTYAGGGDQTLLANVATILNEIAPAADRPSGTQASIHAYRYQAVTQTIDTNTGVSKTLTAVDSAGVQNVNVVSDFTIGDTTANIDFTITRLTITMQVSAGLWTASSGEIAASAV